MTAAGLVKAAVADTLEYRLCTVASAIRVRLFRKWNLDANKHTQKKLLIQKTKQNAPGYVSRIERVNFCVVYKDHTVTQKPATQKWKVGTDYEDQPIHRAMAHLALPTILKSTP